MQHSAPSLCWKHGNDVSAQEVDAYLAGIAQPKRATLQQLRETTRPLLPEAQKGISYGCPAFLMHGNVVAGFAALKDHLSYLPHSGSVLSRLRDDLAGHGATKSTLHLPVGRSLPRPPVSKLIQANLEELQLRRSRTTPG